MADTTTKRGRGRPKKSKSKARIEKVEKVSDVKKTENVRKEVDTPSEQAEVVEEFVNSQPEIQEKMAETEVKGFEIDDAEIVDTEYTPLSEDVEYRGYEQGSAILNQGEGIDIPIPSLTYESEAQAAEDIPKDTGVKNGESTFAQNSATPQAAAPKSEEKSHWESNHSKQSETTTETPAEKRKNATKMADTLLMVYRENVPLLFKYVAKFNEGKISRMELNGEIDRAMPVLEDGTTVGQYIANVNLQVDNTFVVTEEQAAEIREPLIDWLMEKDLKLTPSQRLAIAIGGQMVSFGLAAVQQWQQNRHAMNQFAEFHADWRQSRGGVGGGHGARDVPPVQESPPAQSDYAPVEEVVPQEQEHSPMDNLSDHDLADNNIIKYSEEADYTVEDAVEEEISEINMDSWMNEKPNEQPYNEDIPL